MNRDKAYNAGHQLARTEKCIRGLTAQLFKLSPYEGCTGAAFVSLNSAFNPPAECESILGCIFVEAAMGNAMTLISSNDNGLDVSILSEAASYDKVVDFASHYLEDRSEDTHNNYGRGRGSIARYEECNAVRACFQSNSAPEVTKRKQIEGHIAALLREMDAYSHAQQMGL